MSKSIILIFPFIFSFLHFLPLFPFTYTWSSFLMTPDKNKNCEKRITFFRTGVCCLRLVYLSSALGTWLFINHPRMVLFVQLYPRTRRPTPSHLALYLFWCKLCFKYNSSFDWPFYLILPHLVQTYVYQANVNKGLMCI